MRCIFCLEERPPSDEHVFPDAIGGTLTIDRVCKPCNDWLGANVDAPLTNDDFIIFKRAEFGMRHPNGRPVDSWARIFSNSPLLHYPDQRVHVVRDPVSGEVEPKLTYKSVRTKLADGSEAVHITLDASQVNDIEKIIQRERGRANMAPLPDQKIAVFVTAAKV